MKKIAQEDLLLRSERMVGLTAARRRDLRKNRLLHAVVHWECIWINGDAVTNLTATGLKQLAKILLDAGVPVKGYWTDCNYSSIDRRIGMGTVRTK